MLTGSRGTAPTAVASTTKERSHPRTVLRPKCMLTGPRRLLPHPLLWTNPQGHETPLLRTRSCISGRGSQPTSLHLLHANVPSPLDRAPRLSLANLSENLSTSSDPRVPRGRTNVAIRDSLGRLPRITLTQAPPISSTTSLIATFLPWWGPASRREWDGAEASPQTRPSEAARQPKAGKVSQLFRQDLPELVEAGVTRGSAARRRDDSRITSKPSAWTTIGEVHLLWCKGFTWERILSGAVSTGARGSTMVSRPSSLTEDTTDRMHIAGAVIREKKKI